METDYDVIVIGGGAAGMMAAGRAAERGKRVLLLEKNRVLGKKLSITGGGRCNITHAEEDSRILLREYGAAEKFLYSPFSQFGVADTFAFFAARKLPIVVQAGQRAFPVTEKATDVVRVLTEYMRTSGVTVQTGAHVSGFVSSKKEIAGVTVNGIVRTATSYILATGGASHPETGSSGDGFRWLAKLGHHIQKPSPAIVPIAVEDAWVKALAGKSLDEVKLTFFVDDKKSLVLKGRILCTHFGLSGPLILNAAAKVSDLLHEGKVTGAIDFFPSLDIGALDKRIVSLFDANKNKAFGNVLRQILPPGAASVVLPQVSAIDPETKVHSISKENRKFFVRDLKRVPLSVRGLMGLDRAVVADGGLPLNEIDPKTMASRRFPYLFVTGDLLNINRPSGGYSLQLCWTTGYVAGSHA